MNNTLLAGLVVLVLVFGGIGLLKEAPKVEVTVDLDGLANALQSNRDQLGGAGAEQFFPWSFRAGVYVAGFKDLNTSILNVTTTPLGDSTRTLSAFELCENPFSDVRNDTATGTLTLPGAPDFRGSPCLRDVGDKLSFTLRNTSPPTSSIKFVAGASSTIVTLNAATTSQAGTEGGFSTSSFVGGSIAEFTGYRFVSSTEEILWTLRLFGR